MNSPDDDRPHAAARTLYLFACQGKDCLIKDSSQSYDSCLSCACTRDSRSLVLRVKIFRTQMPSPNTFYPHTSESIASRVQAGESLSDKADCCIA